MNEKLIALGMAWYREDDYPTIRTLMNDRDRFPLTFTEWVNRADKGRQELIAKGHVVVQAYIESQTFPTWCRMHGLNIDAKARMRFANLEAIRVASEMRGNG